MVLILTYIWLHSLTSASWTNSYSFDAQYSSYDSMLIKHPSSQYISIDSSHLSLIKALTIQSILYLAVNKRLATKDRLSQWQMIQETECSLCQQEAETMEHVFFQCLYVAEIWSKLLTWQGINRTTMGWSDEIQWAIKYMKGKGSTFMVYRMTIACTTYNLWMERKRRIFQ